MRYLLLILFLCTTPFAPSHANEPMIDIITAIKIEGIDISTSVEDARYILMERGYEEGLSSPRSTRFTKGGCHIEVGHMMSTSMLKYHCNGSNPDADAVIIGALDALCAAEDKGQDERAGCHPPNPQTNMNRRESFQIKVEEGKYTVNIVDNHNNSGPRTRHIDIITLIRK